MRIAEMFPIELIETNENAVADNSIILEDDTPEKTGLWMENRLLYCIKIC